jgi:hypothetical protein
MHVSNGASSPTADFLHCSALPKKCRFLSLSVAFCEGSITDLQGQKRLTVSPPNGLAHWTALDAVFRWIFITDLQGKTGFRASCHRASMIAVRRSWRISRWTPVSPFQAELDHHVLTRMSYKSKWCQSFPRFSCRNDRVILPDPKVRYQVHDRNRLKDTLVLNHTGTPGGFLAGNSARLHSSRDVTRCPRHRLNRFAILLTILTVSMKSRSSLGWSQFFGYIAPIAVRNASRSWSGLTNKNCRNV